MERAEHRPGQVDPGVCVGRALRPGGLGLWNRHQPTALFLSPFVGMAFGAFIVWAIGKILALVIKTLFVTLPGLIFGKRQPR